MQDISKKQLAAMYKITVTITYWSLAETCWIRGVHSLLLLLLYYMHEPDQSHSFSHSYSYSCVYRSNRPHRETQGSLSFVFNNWKCSHPPGFHIILQFFNPALVCLIFFSGCHLSWPFIQFKSSVMHFWGFRDPSLLPHWVHTNESAQVTRKWGHYHRHTLVATEDQDRLGPIIAQ